MALALDSRIRIDALLGRRTRSRSDVEDNFTPLPTVKRGSIAYDSDEHARRGSRGGDMRRSSRDVNEQDRMRGQSERDPGSRDQTTKQNNRRETSEQVISHRNSQGCVDVGGVTLANKMMDANGNPQGGKTKVQHQMLESKAAINLSASPKLAKKPFKFGTISLQVKLDD